MTIKSQVLFGLFHACLRDAVFFLDKDDVEMIKARLIANGIASEAVERIPKSYFTKRNRCRRTVPQRLELAVRVQAVFELFDGLVDSDGIPLITEKVRKVHERCMEHIWNGCLSDPLGIPMYYTRGEVDGMPEYVTSAKAWLSVLP